VGDRLLRDGPDSLLFIKPMPSRLPAGVSHGRRADTDAPVPTIAKA
jgi:hypothetical protein